MIERIEHEGQCGSPVCPKCFAGRDYEEAFKSYKEALEKLRNG